ncbi:hypothetical protein IAE16_07695 [Hydrogenobacter sp. T-2]|uniref:hypothetical protein n=1 Tax=Pampinifervens diazotrophicum TaxID=1632018 RepID=UPI002B26426C|nr:hypothetical protein [Hydrogenobacter sp. T-2]WPM31700.1 hypothetical protein IAE16_07695 [Hydrogenobacter sp. T-2]
MAQFFSIDDLQAIIRYKIGELKRLKRDLSLEERIPSVDNFSLMVLYSKHLSEQHLENISKSMRESDIIAQTGSHLICLLPGTDKEGAIHLAEGIKDFLGEEGYYTVVTYPEDGESYEDLIASLKLYSEQKGIPIPII